MGRKFKNKDLTPNRRPRIQARSDPEDCDEYEFGSVASEIMEVKIHLVTLDGNAWSTILNKVFLTDG